jgi:phosphatidylserine synthase
MKKKVLILTVKIVTTLALIIAELSILSLLLLKPDPIVWHIAIALVSTGIGIIGLVMWALWSLKNKP